MVELFAVGFCRPIAEHGPMPGPPCRQKGAPHASRVVRTTWALTPRAGFSPALRHHVPSPPGAAKGSVPVAPIHAYRIEGSDCPPHRQGEKALLEPASVEHGQARRRASGSTGRSRGGWWDRPLVLAGEARFSGGNAHLDDTVKRMRPVTTTAIMAALRRSHRELSSTSEKPSMPAFPKARWRARWKAGSQAIRGAEGVRFRWRSEVPGRALKSLMVRIPANPPRGEARQQGRRRSGMQGGL